MNALDVCVNTLSIRINALDGIYSENVSQFLTDFFDAFAEQEEPDSQKQGESSKKSTYQVYHDFIFPQ